MSNSEDSKEFQFQEQVISHIFEGTVFSGFSQFLHKFIVVDAFSGGINISAGLESVIMEHGGKISQKITKKTTHYVYMNGDAERLKRACHYTVKIVTPLWVDEYFFQYL